MFQPLANIIFSEETQKEKGILHIVLMPGFKTLASYSRRITYACLGTSVALSLSPIRTSAAVEELCALLVECCTHTSTFIEKLRSYDTRKNYVRL